MSILWTATLPRTQDSPCSTLAHVLRKWPVLSFCGNHETITHLIAGAGKLRAWLLGSSFSN